MGAALLACIFDMSRNRMVTKLEIILNVFVINVYYSWAGLCQNSTKSKSELQDLQGFSTLVHYTLHMPCLIIIVDYTYVHYVVLYTAEALLLLFAQPMLDQHLHRRTPLDKHQNDVFGRGVGYSLFWTNKEHELHKPNNWTKFRAFILLIIHELDCIIDYTTLDSHEWCLQCAFWPSHRC